MTRPVIGISCNIDHVDSGVFRRTRSATLNQAYVDQVDRAGGIALLIPPRVDVGGDFVETILCRVDALILSGGGDIEAGLFGHEAHPRAGTPQADRDNTEIALARRAAELDMPMLGICRGMQVMAVAAGGTIEQHVPDRVGTDEHNPTVGVYASHPVSITEGSTLATILGTSLEVPTYHHQAVDAHPGYDAVAWHADGTLEAMEAPQANFRIAVQWHPEMSDDNRIFVALVGAAR